MQFTIFRYDMRFGIITHTAEEFKTYKTDSPKR